MEIVVIIKWILPFRFFVTSNNDHKLVIIYILCAKLQVNFDHAIFKNKFEVIDDNKNSWNYYTFYISSKQELKEHLIDNLIE